VTIFTITTILAIDAIGPILPVNPCCSVFACGANVSLLSWIACEPYLPWLTTFTGRSVFSVDPCCTVFSCGALLTLHAVFACGALLTLRAVFACGALLTLRAVFAVYSILACGNALSECFDLFHPLRESCDGAGNEAASRSNDLRGHRFQLM